MNVSLPRIALTAGEPAGIGPDLCVMLAHQALPAEVVVIADAELVAARAAQLGLTVEILPYRAEHAAFGHAGDGKLNILHVPTAETAVAGKLNPANSRYVLQTLIRAADGCSSDEFDAMVTGPVHKGVINDAGIAFSGHTEFLAEHTHTPRVVMMLVGGGVNVTLGLPIIRTSVDHGTALDLAGHGGIEAGSLLAALQLAIALAANKHHA